MYPALVMRWLMEDCVVLFKGVLASIGLTCEDADQSFFCGFLFTKKPSLACF